MEIPFPAWATWCCVTLYGRAHSISFRKQNSLLFLGEVHLDKPTENRDRNRAHVPRLPL